MTSNVMLKPGKKIPKMHTVKKLIDCLRVIGLESVGGGIGWTLPDTLNQAARISI